MITCRELAELLGDFLNDECSQDQRHLIEQHLVICRQCVVFMETYRLTMRITRQLPDQPLPPTLQQRLQAILQQLRGQGSTT